MIELFLSTDGKHTVHVSADTPEQMKDLVPKAKALYQEVLAEFGAKAPLLGNRQGNQARGVSNGQMPFSKRIDTLVQAQAAMTPHCPVHQTPMKYRQGRRGAFWSCPTRNPHGEWCRQTEEVNAVSNGQGSAG